MSESLFIFLNIVGMGPERAHGLRAFTALGKGPSLASSTHIGCLPVTCTPLRGAGVLQPLSTSRAAMFT